MPLAVGGGPPRFEQVVGFLVQQLRIQVLANELHHGLPQFLVMGEIEDDVQAGLSQDLLDTLLDGGSERDAVGITMNVTTRLA